MSAFFIFVFVMSFTPGPNTMMAMAGQQRGFRSSTAQYWHIRHGFYGSNGRLIRPLAPVNPNISDGDENRWYGLPHLSGLPYVH